MLVYTSFTLNTGIHIIHSYTRYCISFYNELKPGKESLTTAADLLRRSKPFKLPLDLTVYKVYTESEGMQI